jgi:hypothetical protein
MPGSQSSRDTVLNLQRLYAVIMALAISEASKAFFSLGPQQPAKIQVDCWPQFFTFFITIVPFFHGMNRHLEVAHANGDSKHPKLFLLLDFYAFFALSLFFLALGTQITHGLAFFWVLMWLFIADFLWALLSKLFIKSGQLWWWIVLDFVSIIYLYLALSSWDNAPAWVPAFSVTTIEYCHLPLFAILRTALDYVVNRKFYFPDEQVTPISAASHPAGDLPGSKGLETPSASDITIDS